VDKGPGGPSRSVIVTVAPLVYEKVKSHFFYIIKNPFSPLIPKVTAV